VHVGDKTLSALLAAPTGLCMMRGRTVWFMCSGWGSLAAVDGSGMCATTVSRLRTAVSTARRVTVGTDVAKVFSKFEPLRSGERPETALQARNFRQQLATRGTAAGEGLSAWSAGESGWSAL
jgi:hypothetical protein